MTQKIEICSRQAKLRKLGKNIIIWFKLVFLTDHTINFKTISLALTKVKFYTCNFVLITEHLIDFCRSS